LAPIAESICVHLRANGIEAFSKGTSQLGALMRIASDFGPTEVWVASHDLERAQALLGREGSTT